MANKPIQFSAPMVRSLLHGTKAQAQHIIKNSRRYLGVNVLGHTRVRPTSDDREAALREGWLLCQSVVLAMCEDVQREANEEWPEMDQFSRGMKRASKSISRGMWALSPDDSTIDLNK